ncbi:ABC transporter permease [candidate division KSB1 bacterium]|nr:ABC transporter permease [candidate division KSB1 bacterium]
MAANSHWRLLNQRLGPFLGLIVIFVIGIILNGDTFLNIYNQLNVLGRVSIIALPAVGMTLVILTAGIDLSVGSMVSLASVVCAMLLMERDWTRATSLALPIYFVFIFIAGYYVVRKATRRLDAKKSWSVITGIAGGLIVAVTMVYWTYPQVSTGFGTLSVLIIVPVLGLFLGALNGIIIAKGKIQPFIVTLGMMSSAVGLAKFIAGKGGQIHPIYFQSVGMTAGGKVAPESFDVLSSKISLFGVKLFPVAGLFFLCSVIIIYFVLTRLKFGRYVYAIGGNEETARLSGINVDRVKTIVYAIAGGLSALAGVLYCSAYTQGKADAGITWELDAIAAVVIGGTSLMGGKGTVVGTMVGVLILGYLGNILNLQEVSSEVQDILKGVIIVGAVLLQEGIFARWMRAFLKKIKDEE